MFHFGLPTEQLEFQDDSFYIKRYEKLLYIGSGKDALPLPIAKNAVYVDYMKVNIDILIKNVKQMYSILKDPQVQHSTVDGYEITEVLFEWGENLSLTRYELRFICK